jgi:hypothetical protein
MLILREDLDAEAEKALVADFVLPSLLISDTSRRKRAKR